MEQKFSNNRHLDLQDIASFLNVTPKTISKIRKEITFGKD